ncbi:MAG: 50S ribosomal protein L23 [Chloroflexi bacterium]|nr:50S ribosomal protein L23 [Chloroflexota bacterium]|tara:strand:- start:2441 stop:2725 length:285 start_codon:yes stop_codon:yes gene_type:complete
MDPYSIIINPVVTEKSTLLQEKGKYTFDVYKSSSKTDIIRAVENVFDVKVDSVNTFNIKGKTRRVGRNLAKRPDKKRAIVTLKSGESIQLFEGT